MKINLGCGKAKMKGFVNIDEAPKVNPDIVSDIKKTPWPWAKNNQANLIYSDNLFEHIEPRPLIKIVQECHRVLKPGGILKLRLPLLAPDNLNAAFSDPMHVNYFTTETFDYYDHRHFRWRDYGSVYGIPKFERIRQERKARFLIVELKVIK